MPEGLAARAVDAARNAGLDTVAAEGLIELGTAVAPQTRTRCRSSSAGPRDWACRGTGCETAGDPSQASICESASSEEQVDRCLEARRTSSSSSSRSTRYRRFELTALGIISQRPVRSLVSSRRRARRRRRSSGSQKRSMMTLQTASALENLAGQSSTLGSLLPDALRFRERAEEIHRRQGNAYTLAFDLTNRAELLIRLGHGEKAEALLREVVAGIDKGIDAYVGRTRRVKVLRTLRATVDGRWADTVTAGLSVGPGTGQSARWDGAPGVGARRSCPRTSAPRRRLAFEPDPPASLPLPTSREIRDRRLGDPPGFRRKRGRVGWRVGTARRALPRAVARARVASGRNGRSRGPAAARPRGFRARPRRPRPAGLAAARDHLGERISLDLHGASRYSRAAPGGPDSRALRYGKEHGSADNTRSSSLLPRVWRSISGKFKKRLGGDADRPEIIVRNGKLRIRSGDGGKPRQELEEAD